MRRAARALRETTVQGLHRLALLALPLLLLAGTTAPAAAETDDANVLVLGRISDDPATHYEQLKPLLDYVVAHMHDVGIREGRILMARDLQQMASYLRRGRVDWVTETSGAAMTLQQRAGAEPLLLTERDGVSGYRTVIFVRNDSPVKTLADLRGRSIAFQNPSSTSAYFVPAAALLHDRLGLEILLSPRDRPGGDSVGYVFGRTEANISTWVHKRLVDAGALSELDFASPMKVPPAFRDDLRVIYTSPQYPRGLEVTRSGLSPRVRERLREVLLQAADDPLAGPALRQFFHTTRFLPIDARDAQLLARLRSDVRMVSEEVE
jgi:phosphonate transport system substrate-binding protein